MTEAKIYTSRPIADLGRIVSTALVVYAVAEALNIARGLVEFYLLAQFAPSDQLLTAMTIVPLVVLAVFAVAAS